MKISKTAAKVCEVLVALGWISANLFLWLSPLFGWSLWIPMVLVVTVAAVGHAFPLFFEWRN